METEISSEIETYLENLSDMEISDMVISTMNTVAFLMKKRNIPKTLEKLMTIRSPNFMNRMIWVNPASKTRPYSEVGSLYKKNHSGWIEQATGKRAEIDRIILNARERNSEKVPVRARLKPSNHFPSLTKLKKTSRYVHSFEQAAFFIFREARQSPGRKFIIDAKLKSKKTAHFETGLYGNRGGKIKRLQLTHERYKVDQNRWMKKAIDLIPDELIGRIFMKKLERQFNRLNKGSK